MLKIKDNIDLKELEKFGFQLNDDDEYELKIAKNNYMTIIAVVHKKMIIIQSNGYVIKELSVLYDLIKADLIDKVGE